MAQIRVSCPTIQHKVPAITSRHITLLSAFHIFPTASSESPLPPSLHPSPHPNTPGSPITPPQVPSLNYNIYPGHPPPSRPAAKTQ